MAYNDFVALVREKTKKNTAAEKSAAVSAVGNPVVDRMIDYMKYQRIGYDTLGDDINSLLEETEGYLEGGWADGNATAAQKQSVGEMISRLKLAKQYYTDHADQFSGDVSKSIAEIDSKIGALTELSGYIDETGKVYSNYKSREEYDKAISDYKFTSQYKDMSAEELEHIVSDLKFLKWGHDMNGNGFALHGVNQDNYSERIAHLESLLAEKQVENYVTWAKQQGDFAEKSNYVAPGVSFEKASAAQKLYMLVANPGLAYTDNVLNDDDWSFGTDEPLKQLYGLYQGINQTAELGSLLELSKDEKDTFFYLYNTGQITQAFNYFSTVKDIGGKRLSEDVNAVATKMAAEHPWLSTIAAVGTNIVLSVPNAVENIADAVTGGGYDKYSGVNLLGGATDTIYGTVPEVWAKKYGWDKDITSFIYSTGVSIAQNVGTSLLFGGYSGTKIGEIASLAAMGTQAANSTMRDLAAQGAEDWQIYALGIISGAAEMAMEKVPLENLIKIGKEGGKAGLKATLKNILGQAWDEFKEESATELINILADSIFRLDESELAKAVGEKGLFNALKDSIGQVIMAGASGAVSGGIMGSAFSIYGGTVGSAQYRPVGKFMVDNGAADILIKQGLKLGQGSEAYEIADLLRRRMANNKEGKLNAVSYADVGRLYALETAAVREQYMQATEKKLSVQLEAAGVKASKVEGLAAALAKAISGEQMTRSETKAIGKSAQAMQILEQSRAMLDPARVAFNPIQKSTAYAIADGAMVITRLGNSNMYRVDLLPSANAERVASTGEIGDGAVRTLESQSVRQVERMVKKAAEGAGIADISSGFGEQISPDAAVAVTMLSAALSGVDENVAGIAAGIVSAMGGDLRIVFDPELSETGDTGLFRKNYDGTREAYVTPTLGGVISALIHELFHDIEDTPAGKAFIAAAVEYAKTQPARNPKNGANRYEEVKHLYQTRKGVNDKAELETEVGAKISGDSFASLDVLKAVLEHMKPQQKASLRQRLKRALTSLRNKLKGQKNAKPAETQLNVLERLYKQAFAQRVIQDAVENPRVGDPGDVSESEQGTAKEKTPEKVKHSYAGENAETADKMSLARAKGMLENGADSETVRRETGWFKGYDGKWRFEIDDSKAVWHLDTAKPNAERLFNFGEKVYKLGDLLDHKELYAAYPQLKDVTVYVNPYAEFGGYVVGRNTDSFSVKDIEDSLGTKWTMIHEIQHLIQNIEGFARGGSKYEYSQKEWGDKEYAALDKRKEIAKSLYAILRRNGQSIPKEAIEREYYSTSVSDEIIESNYFTLQSLGAQNKRTQSLIDAYYEQVQILNATTPEGQYFATAGEIEAYDVQARMGMSAEERKNTRPNIDRDDAIVKGVIDNNGEQNSIKKTSQIPYKEQLSRMERGQLGRSDSLYIGVPSQNLQRAGMSNAPFAMNQGDYRKSRRASANNKNYSSHAVPYDFFEKMPTYLGDASLFIDSGNKLSVITSYEMNDTKGNRSFVIAGVWKNSPMENYTVNQVKSVYPLDDFVERIKSAAEGGKLVVTNAKKAEQMLATVGVQPSEVSRIVSLSRGIITQINSDVNTQFSLSSENVKKAVFGSEKVEDDTSGSFGVKACLSEADSIGQKSIAYNERNRKVNAAVLKVGVEVMMEMAETMKPYLEEEGILPPDTNRNNGKTLFKNGSYGRTAENTTKCVRTLTYDDFKDRVAEEIGRPLTVAESLLVSQKIYDIATDPQCIYCYVAADRKAYDEYLGEYHAAMDKYIKALKDGGDSDELYQEYIGRNPKNDTKARRRRWEAWKKLARSGGKYITAADLATSAKRNAIIDRGGALAEQVKDAQRYAQSASWAKKVEEYRAYNGEILKLTQQLVDTLNSEYGLRMYSFSDYTPAFIVENMQMIIDAACRGLKSLAYTKDTDYAKIFARTGQAINISCFAKWQDGVYVEDSRQGADWAEAKKLREQYPNVGVVMVAVTDPMVEWAVRQDWIDVVIPYHIVKTGTKIANEYQWRNFTADSADKAGNRVANIYPTEHNNDFATYKRLIEERGLTPRFNEYYERVAKGELAPEQYMKLVNEVRLPASELSAVVPDFDLDAARESFGVDAEGNVIKGGFVDKGGYMGSWYREGVDVEQAAMQVADDIRAGKSSLEVEYGMNSRAKLMQAKKYGVEKADVAEDEIPNSSREYAQMKKQKEAPEIDPDAEMKAIKNQAEIHQDRVYSSAEIERALKAIEAVKNTNAAVARIARKLAVAFNTTEDADKIRTAAVAAADEMVSHAVAEGKIADGEEALTAEYIIKLRDKIADDIVEAHKSGGHDSLKLRLETAQAAARVIIDATKAREMARHKRETGQLACDEWKDLTKAVGKIVSRYSVSVKNTRDFAKKYKAFIETQANSLHKAILDYTGDEDLFKVYIEEKRSGKNQVLEIIDMSVARQVYEMAELGEDIPLSSEELKILHAALRNLLALDNRYNRVHMDGRWQNTDKYAKQGIADSESEYGSDGKKQIGVGWVKQVEDPYDVASSVGGHNRDSVLARAVRAIQHAATEAQYKEMQYMKEVEDFFDSHKAFRKKYRDQRIEFKTVRKNPVTGQQVEGSVTMTLGEFLGLYMTSKRKQAFISLAMSDIVFDKMPGVRDHEQRLAGLKMQYEGLTEVQIEAAVRGMGNALIAEIQAQYEKLVEANSEIKGFVEVVERFYNETSTSEKTETDLLLYGYTNVLGGYYYPLERDKNAFDVNLIGNDRIIGNMIGVGNFSFNKATVERASKPLMIRDTMTVMRRHAHQLATYTTMTVPLQNINRIYNCKVNDTTLKDFIHNNVWSGFGKYLRNYLLDVQGSRRADADFEELRSILSTVKSNYAKSVLAMNPKSILTQFSTVIAMQGQVSYASWAKGLAMVAFLQRTEGEDGKILARLAEMDKYSHGAAVRNDSNEIYLATGAVGKLGNVTDKLMIGQLLTDRLTCLAMYAMCQYEVQRTQGLAVGTAENKAAAGKMLDDMILNLQDTSAAATKTALARSTNEFISNFAMFKSAELKQFSRIAYALADMRAHGVTRARVGAFSKELGAFLGSKVYAAVIALVWAAFRGKWEEDEEGKDKGYIEMLTSELFMDMVGFVPVFGSLAENVMTGFGLELPSESVVNDLITAIRSTGGIISDIADGGGFEYKKAVNILSSVGQALGLPVRNLANIVDGAFNMAGLADSRIKYNYDKFMSGGSATVDELREAIDAGDERLAETVADMLMVDRVGSSVGSEAAGEIVSLYASGETGVLPSKIGNKITVSINDESREIELTAAEQRELRAEYGKATSAVRRMVSTSAYSRLTTSERAVAVRDMNRLYMDRAKAKLYGADMTTAVAMTYLMSEGKYICACAHIKAIKADKSIKNKATQIKRWLRSQGLSVAEQRAILYASGYRSEENLAAVKRLLRSASLSAKEKAAVRAALSIE